MGDGSLLSASRGTVLANFCLLAKKLSERFPKNNIFHANLRWKHDLYQFFSQVFPGWPSRERAGKDVRVSRSRKAAPDVSSPAERAGQGCASKLSRWAVVRRKLRLGFLGTDIQAEHEIGFTH